MMMTTITMIMITMIMITIWWWQRWPQRGEQVAARIARSWVEEKQVQLEREEKWAQNILFCFSWNTGGLLISWKGKWKGSYFKSCYCWYFFQQSSDTHCRSKISDKHGKRWSWTHFGEVQLCCELTEVSNGWLWENKK